MRSYFSFDQTICFSGSEKIANMHAIHVFKCSGMFKRKVWNWCLMLLTETDGMKAGCNLHIRFSVRKNCGREGGREGVALG